MEDIARGGGGGGGKNLKLVNIELSEENIYHQSNGVINKQSNPNATE